MSLIVKCFATAIKDSKDSKYNEGFVVFHSTMYDLNTKDFVTILNNSTAKESGFYSLYIVIGAGPDARGLTLDTPAIFTKYSYNEINKRPIPIINQPISLKKNEQQFFIVSRFWIFRNYFFVTNRNYSSSEEREVKMKIHYLVKKFDDELSMIGAELKSIGVSY